jgi:hypothetical protein
MFSGIEGSLDVSSDGAEGGAEDGAEQKKTVSQGHGQSTGRKSTAMLDITLTNPYWRNKVNKLLCSE